MHSDPIADLLTRIRNAQAVRKKEFYVPHSKIKMAILDILVREKWITSATVVPAHFVKLSRSAPKQQRIMSRFDQIKVILKYKDEQPVIQSLKRVSTPGRRVYVGNKHLPKVLNHFGMALVSTSRGVMTDSDARKLGVGGEVICEIY